MEDAWLTGLAGLALGLHLGVLPFVWRARRPRLLALVNLAVALPALVLLLDRPRLLAAPLDWQVLGLAGFEAVAILSALALAAGRRLGWLALAAFGCHLLMSLAALLFGLFFRMTRLI